MDGGKEAFCDQNKDEKREKRLLVKPPDAPSECNCKTDDDRCQKEEYFLRVEIEWTDIHKKKQNLAERGQNL